ncbi:MAG: hypothetical protein JXK05_05145 [Campylobacterales bacterium]|nr:hypothetical protein [Campylobacterales bacterium]
MKTITLLLLFLPSLFAVEITIKPSSTYTANQQEVGLLQSMFMKQRIQIDADDALDLIQQNRFLSDHYLATNKIPEEVMLNLRLEFEKHLASEVVREMEAKITIDDEVTKSYYVANNEEFKKPKSIKLSIFRFETFNEALAFYTQFVDLNAEVDSFAKEHNISSSTEAIEINKLNKLFQEMIAQSKTNPPFLLPPQFFYKHYSVLYVRSVSEQGVYEYEDVKDKIEKIIHEQALDRMKKELLKPYRQKEES